MIGQGVEARAWRPTCNICLVTSLGVGMVILNDSLSVGSGARYSWPSGSQPYEPAARLKRNVLSKSSFMVLGLSVTLNLVESGCKNNV